MKLLASVPLDGDKIGILQDAEMLGDGRARHRQTPAKLVERLAGAAAQAIEQFTPALVGQGSENDVAAIIKGNLSVSFHDWLYETKWFHVKRGPKPASLP
jgi:hypothetical protein